VAASSKVISLVLFSEQNFGQRMDFGNFGRYAGWRPVPGGPYSSREILRTTASAEVVPPGKILFFETANKAKELKALSHYFDPFGDMWHGPAGGPFHADVTGGKAPFHATGGYRGMASIRRSGFGGIIKLYH
jgi:hypothetical protein